ncbi:L-threonylcarbamoyladenylate synthase [Robbsia sp. Bb-Pol-6]|uniref:Threonylcarbamoyl-AMP synthase n=1 Tax=Robbsia betulipollinis TaxID=2981849 RepID=A0ABT3ZLU5_9BURK|nr:L-threonylcarbamoyladenylate synthase [Robbsia betulipollinis]MCY0387509.1 L-threonylcarbamoyladenylate synthase [Robbsia betulipollinis]
MTAAARPTGPDGSACLPAGPEGIAAAAAWLGQGQLVGFPTETVYGLGADAADPVAVARIYAAKGRPSNHPVIVHLPPGGDPLWWAADLPPAAQALIDAFWPGPLTLILGRAARIPAAVSGGQDSIGLRCPSHPVAQALLEAFSALRGGHGGVAAPSANRFGKVSPTAARHVRDEFGDAIPVLDGGDSAVGIESTIVDLSRGFPALLRPGHVTPEQIAAVLGGMPSMPSTFASQAASAPATVAMPFARDGHAGPAPGDRPAPRASGTLRAHYAPATPLALLSAPAIAAILRARAADVPGMRYAVVTHSAAGAAALAGAADVEWVQAPANAAGYARVLYGMLRALDGAHVVRILVEALPDDPAWQAVADRLGRAAAAFLPEAGAAPD